MGKYHSDQIYYNISCWILDSGASINIINNIHLLRNIKNCNETVHLANGDYLNAKSISSFKEYINNKEFIIDEVHYSSNINKNLISISSLIKQNYKIVFKNIHSKA